MENPFTAIDYLRRWTVDFLLQRFIYYKLKIFQHYQILMGKKMVEEFSLNLLTFFEHFSAAFSCFFFATFC